MSADNYYVVREFTGGSENIPSWSVTMGFASAEGDPDPPSERDPWFDTFEEAYAYAFNEYSEYGVHILGDMPMSELDDYWRGLGVYP